MAREAAAAFEHARLGDIDAFQTPGSVQERLRPAAAAWADLHDAGA